MCRRVRSPATNLTETVREDSHQRVAAEMLTSISSDRLGGRELSDSLLRKHIPEMLTDLLRHIPEMLTDLLRRFPEPRSWAKQCAVCAPSCDNKCDMQWASGT